MLAFLFVVATASMAFPFANAASDCSLCKLGQQFTESNGYGCFPLSNGNVACTCPDQRYTLDKPCRICERNNICGSNPDNFCSETLQTTSNVQGNSAQYFTCFCTDFMFYIGQPCPTTTTTSRIPITSTIRTTETIRTTITIPITTATIPVTTSRISIKEDEN